MEVIHLPAYFLSQITLQQMCPTFRAFQVVQQRAYVMLAPQRSKNVKMFC